MTEPCQLSATEMALALNSGDLSPKTIAVSCIERIKVRDDEVRAWAHFDPKQVLNSVKSLSKGPLFGIPVGVKDIIETHNMPTEYGSKIYSAHQPDKDAECVVNIKTNGGLVMGKTVTTEFAWRHANQTQNPHNPAHTPGGSSSGSAAAVADFQVALALGTQTAGSVIRPAAYCGVVGFKPTYGRYPIIGVKPLSPSLDTIGLFARSVSDIAFFDTALTGDKHDLFSTPPKIATCLPFQEQLEEVGAKAIEDSISSLSRAGSVVEETEIIATFDEIVSAHETIMIGEIGRALIYELENFPEYLNDYYRDNINRGASIPDDEIAIAKNTLHKARKTLAALFENTDLILTPPASGPAPEGLEFTGDPLFNKIWTALGWPCLTLPIVKDAHSLPIGIQLVSPKSDVSTFLANAAWVEDTIKQK